MQEHVVARLWQVLTIQNHFMVKLQKRRRALFQMLEVIVATIEQGIQHQRRALRCVGKVGNVVHALRG